MFKSPFTIPIIFTALLFLTNCSSDQKSGSGMVFKLEITDSFQVAYSGQFHGIDFHDTEGILYNFREGSFHRFDIKGEILEENIIPREGPNSIAYIGGLKMMPDGLTYIQSLKGEIGILDRQLNLIEKFQMPFSPALSDLRSNVKSMEISEGKVYIYFPGRDGANPYEKGFFMKNHLLEKVDMETGGSSPFLQLPDGSKYHADLYFEHPFVFLSIFEDKIYFAFDNEPIIYVYRLDDGEFLEDIPIEASNFVELEGQVLPLDLTTIKIPGMIDGLYAFDDGVAVNYLEGITEETLKEDRGNDPHNGQIDSQSHILKVYHKEKGWSNEITIPMKISYILNFESPQKEFYALKNDPIPSTERSAVTFYKLRLSPGK